LGAKADIKKSLGDLLPASVDLTVLRQARHVVGNAPASVGLLSRCRAQYGRQYQEVEAVAQ
jgi:hypothetical protein